MHDICHAWYQLGGWVQGCLSDAEIEKLNAVSGTTSTGKALKKMCSNYVITAEDATAYADMLQPVAGGSICLPKRYNGLTYVPQNWD